MARTRAQADREPRTEVGPGKLTLTVPRALLSPNKWQGRHWRFKHRDTLGWEAALWASYAIQCGTAAALRLMRVGEGAPIRRRVTVTRFVPSARNFIRDDDNLRFSTKPLNDALKRLGLIHSDARNWLEQSMPTQDVSATGEWATVVTIEDVA